MNRNEYDFEFLQNRFESQRLSEADTNTCYVVEQTSTRRKHCGVDHLAGPGELFHQSCEVEFDIYIPKDTLDCHYYIFSSRGTHTHPPAPPNRLPLRLWMSLLELIGKINDPALTTARFLQNPLLKAFCEKYHTQHISQIHASLSNMDRISAMIYKQKVLHYPEGQDFNGVLWEYQVRHENADPSKRYIQFIKYSELSQHKVVICFFE
ncbi:hypothetical protein ABVK25_000571 [Lepraria finkii]|uniref:Uncharacterized protein n=1 Tax=Lepraria finkii TaxID=1340010 RepID=A0ABR4BNB8_9LECA